MTKERMAALFQEWLRRYEADKTTFDADWESLPKSEYGDRAAAYMAKLDAELPA